MIYLLRILKVSANIYLIIGIFLMVLATYNISILYNKQQENCDEDIIKSDIKKYSGNINYNVNEINKYMAAIFYIAAFCIPVTIISLMSGIIGNSQIALGTIIGSNITLILFCRGISYMTKSVRRIMDADIMFLVAVSVVLLFLANDNIFSKNDGIKLISTSDGIIMLLFGILYFFIKIWKNKSDKINIQNTSEENSIESYKQNAQFNVDKTTFNIIKIIQYIKHKYKLVIYIFISAVGSIIYVWNITETTIYIQIGQNKISVLISGTILMSLLITSFFIAKNVDSVERFVDNNSIFTKKTLDNVDNNDLSIKMTNKKTKNKNFFMQRKIENVDRIEEANIILIGIIEFTLVIGVSSIIHNIQISLSTINDMIFLCFIYIIYCLMSNLPDRWDTLKGSIMVTGFIGYVVYKFMFS